MSEWRPVYRADLSSLTMLQTFLEGDEIPTRIAPDIGSEPLQGPAAHNVKSQYQMQVLLVPAEFLERAQELAAAYDQEAKGPATS